MTVATLETHVRKCRAYERCHTYQRDNAYEALMIAQVKPRDTELAECVACQFVFVPRYVGEQVCGRCRS